VTARRSPLKRKTPGARPLTTAVLGRHPLPRLDNSADKEMRGQVLVVGSSRTVPGAALLTGVAALRAGAGKLKLAVPRSLGAAIGVAVPESGIIALAETADGAPRFGAALRGAVARAAAVVVGPGLLAGTGAKLARDVLKLPRTALLILDAGALGAVRRDVKIARRGGTVVLTPNYREMAELAGVSLRKLEAEPLEIARAVAAATGAMVILKSEITHIVTPAGEAWVHEGGMPGLATSGSGDVLAGAIAGLAARCGDPVTACLWGVAAHARAGAALARRIGAVGFLARELAAEIPGTLRRA
jgi:hydroxyethylthiazole kinase-like uncharacterized protein yjeF